MFNHEELFPQLLNEYHLKIPDQLIELFIPSIRLDLINSLRRLLISHEDHPPKRLRIHQMIFNLQQIDSI